MCQYTDIYIYIYCIWGAQQFAACLLQVPSQTDPKQHPSPQKPTQPSPPLQHRSAAPGMQTPTLQQRRASRSATPTQGPAVLGLAIGQLRLSLCPLKRVLLCLARLLMLYAFLYLLVCLLFRGGWLSLQPAAWRPVAWFWQVSCVKSVPILLAYSKSSQISEKQSQAQLKFDDQTTQTGKKGAKSPTLATGCL